MVRVLPLFFQASSQNSPSRSISARPVRTKLHEQRHIADVTLTFKDTGL
jgi:hypothetical protein